MHSSSISLSHHQVFTDDDVPLALHAASRKDAHKVILISSATGVRKEFYKDFSLHLANQGYVVITFDYRGIGDSVSDAYNPHSIKMSQWAIHDLKAVLDWVNENYQFPIYFIGHSIGSELLSLVENNHLIKRALFVGTTHGYWGYLPLRAKLKVLYFSYFIAPILGCFFNYTPISKKGFGANLPAGVTREFGRWLRQKNFYFDSLGKHYPDHRQSYQAKTKILISDDDEYIKLSGTLKFIEQASVTNAEVHIIESSRYGKVGHFGMFRKRHKESIWPLMIDQLNASCTELS